MYTSYSYSPLMEGGIMAFIASYSVAIVILSILGVVCLWKIFSKAGEAGWKSIIPILNIYEEFKIIYGQGWMFLLLLIPFVNIVVEIKLVFDLAKVFGKGIGFGFGLLLLSPIFMLILAFDHSEYQGNTAVLKARKNGNYDNNNGANNNYDMGNGNQQ
jgi:hypothetical protein